MGKDLVGHALRMIFFNFGNALRLSVGPFILLMVAGTLLGNMLFPLFASLFSNGNGADGSSPFLSFVAAIAILFAIFFIFAWVAVAWHRYILLEEFPGLMPRFHASVNGSYLLATLRVSFVIVLTFFAVLLILMPVLAVIGTFFSPDIKVLLGFLGWALFTIGFGWLWFRIGLILPATAVEKPMKIAESMRETERLSGPIFRATVILAIIGIALEIVSGLVGSLSAVLGYIVQIATQWIVVMLGVSMLTTIYGHVIEGRDLVD